MEANPHDCNKTQLFNHEIEGAAKARHNQSIEPYLYINQNIVCIMMMNTRLAAITSKVHSEGSNERRLEMGEWRCCTVDCSKKFSPSSSSLHTVFIKARVKRISAP